MKKQYLLAVFFISTCFDSAILAQSDIKNHFKFVYQKVSNSGSNVFFQINNELIFIEKSEFRSLNIQDSDNKKSLATARGWYAGAGCIYWANYTTDKIEIENSFLKSHLKKICL